MFVFCCVLLLLFSIYPIFVDLEARLATQNRARVVSDGRNGTRRCKNAQLREEKRFFSAVVTIANT